MLPTDLNFFAPNYCSDPFFSHSNFLMNEETEEFVDKTLERIDLVNDEEMTLDQKYTNLSELILNKKFEEAVFFYKKDMTHFFSTRLFEEKFSHYISESNLTRADIKETLIQFVTALGSKTGMAISGIYGKRITFQFPNAGADKQLLQLQASLTRMLLKVNENEYKSITSTSWVAHPITASPAASPTFKIPKYLFGSAVSAIAYTAGYNLVTASGAGISMSLLTPYLTPYVLTIASLFQKVVVRADTLIETGVNGIFDFVITKIDNTIMWFDHRGTFDNRATQSVLNRTNIESEHITEWTKSEPILWTKGNTLQLTELFE